MARDRVTQSENVTEVPGDSRDNQVTSEYHEDEGSTCKPVRKSGRSAAQKARDRIMALHLSEEDEENCC